MRLDRICAQGSWAAAVVALSAGHAMANDHVFEYDWTLGQSTAGLGINNNGGRFRNVNAVFDTHTSRLKFSVTTSVRETTRISPDYSQPLLPQILDSVGVPQATEGFTLVMSDGPMPGDLDDRAWGQYAQYYFDGYQEGIDNIGEPQSQSSAPNTLRSYMDAAGVSLVSSTSSSGTFATHVGDGHTSAYGFNGRKLREDAWFIPDSWQDGQVFVNPLPSQPGYDPNYSVGVDRITGDQTPDRIASINDFQATVMTDVSFSTSFSSVFGATTAVEITRTLMFEVDASDIINYADDGHLLNPNPDNLPWKGTGFAEQIGLWLHTFKGMRKYTPYDPYYGYYEGPEYDQEGFLSQVGMSGPNLDPFSNDPGWVGFFDAFALPTTPIPTPSAVALFGLGGVAVCRRRR